VGGSISRQEKELIMSLIGTVIVTPPGRRRQRRRPAHARAHPHRHPGSAARARRDSATAGLVDVDVYVCDETAECLNPSRATVSVKPFTRLVAERLKRISDNIATRSAQSPADIGFINQTSEPVYRMLAVANAVPGSGTAETLIETYKDVIALDYAQTFLARALAQASTALSQALRRSEVEQRYLDELRAHAREAQMQILIEKQAAYAKVRSVSSMTAGPAEPGAPALERHAPGGEGDAGLQRQRRPARLLSPRNQGADTPGMFEIYAYGNVDTLTGVFNAIAAIMGGAGLPRPSSRPWPSPACWWLPPPASSPPGASTAGAG
jgi:hypothetical protein